MDRSILYAQQGVRGYDLSKAWQDAFKALGRQMQDTLGQTTAMAAGLAATAASPNSLVVNIGAGALYQQGILDATAAGDLPIDDGTYSLQGVSWASQALTLSTSALASGQSQWVLIEAIIESSDIIRSDDPDNGILPFWNSSNPLQPLQGQAGAGGTLPTERAELVTLKLVYGTPATTGSEVPPAADSGWVGLYLIDLAYGQTAITQAEILTAGPSVGTGVPSNYAQAPFLAGLLNQHHTGAPGQAPQIDLTSEVQNVLPNANTTGTTASTANTLALRDSNGELSAVSFNSTSDRRLKKNIVKITGALDLLDLFEGVKFTWRPTNQDSAGLIAQDFYKAIPIGSRFTVNPMAAIAVLTEALREERDARRQLERRVARIKKG